MSHNDPQRPTDTASQEAFDQALRRYARRPPRTSPQMAARKVLHRLEDEATSKPRLKWPTAARPIAAMAAALLVAIIVWKAAPGSERNPFKPDSGTAEISENPQDPAIRTVLDEDVVVIWLDEKTPLYMSLRESPKG